MRRGEIWWADLPPPHGSSPGYRRPDLVIQSDHFNRSGIGTVVVAALTTNLRLAGAPGNVLLPRRLTVFSRDSVLNVSQLLTIDRSLLSGRIRRLPPAELAEIDAGLRLVLAL